LKEEWIQKKMNTFIEKYQKKLFQVKFAVSRNPLVVLHFIFFSFFWLRHMGHITRVIQRT